MSKTLVAALSGLLLLGQNPPTQSTTAQQPTGQAQQPPVFRTGTKQVRVDVTVLDKKGSPLTDLTKEDFELLEDGQPQSIDTIKLIEANGQPSGDRADDMSLEIRSPEHAAEEAARDDVRVFVIFWDEYHIAQMVPAMRGRDALTNFVQTAFGPTDLVAVMDQLTPTDAIRLTRDRRGLADQVHQLKGRQGVYVPPRSPMEEAQLSQGNNVEILRSQVTASALESTIEFLGSIKEGRKSILFVSQTIGQVGAAQEDTVNWLDSTIREANANNVTVYSLDPRGLDMNLRHSDVLISLAENTGGKQFSNNYPAAALKEIVRNSSAFYLLGYVSSKNPADGKYHRISVKVKRPGVEVKARNGYFAPSAAAIDAAAKKAEENKAPPEITKALATISDDPLIVMTGDVWAGAKPGPNGAPLVTAVWTPRASGNTQQGWLRASGDDGHVYFDGPIADRVTFSAAAGTLHLRHQMIEADGSRSDRQDGSIEVPDFMASAIAMTNPVLYRARTPLELRTLLAAADPLPYAGRQFVRTDRVLVRFSVTGTGAPDATINVHLLSKTGSVLATLPLKTIPSGYELDLPVGSIAHGEYVISFEASHGADQAKQLISFRLN